MFKLIKDITDVVLSPLDSAIDILNGLSEGELREKAVLRLGADVIVGLGTSEIIELLATSLVSDNNED